MSQDYMNDPGWQYLRQSDEVRMADQTRPYDSKKDCWIPDPEEGYIAAQIKATKGDMVTVTCSKGDVTLKKEQVSEMNPPKFDKIEDMSNMSFLNDASVFNNLRERYKNMLIYTYSGLFCVVINPYKRLPIYTDSVGHIFMGKRKTEVPPHLFAVSDNAYRQMLADRENQSLLITGESGAGKTENTKKVIAYFAILGSSQAGEKKEEKKTDKKKVSLEEQIVQTNPVLEAFGNAKTVRNNNSSRFGKFIRIHFSGTGKVASCDIEHYLLEKSRVIRQAPGERCYHIFYQMYTNAVPGMREKLLLTEDITYYHFVSQAELTVQGIDDNEEMQMTDEAFDILNFSEQEKDDCYKLMGAHMHMGEAKFKQKSNKDEQAEPIDKIDAEKASQLYGVDVDAFLKAITAPRVRVGTEWVNKGQTVDQVKWGIGAMGKGVYDRVFNWIVSKCNETLDQKELQRQYFIGVLDIAGFEIFDMNSFEQLWINFVNEKLQQFFNHHMFVLEQEEYAREGINWVFIDFGLDLAACIELIEKPMGIISMLDEECVVPKGSDLTLAQKLSDQHLGKHPSFQKPKPPKGKQSEAHFAMAHYAGIVRYNVLTWLEKNKDPLNDTAVSVMKGGTNSLLLKIWGDYVTQEEMVSKGKDGGGGGKKKGKSASMMTVSMKYREGLNNLMSMLNATHPSFVRCLIPNELKKSGVLDAPLVMNQLTCNGVLEGIRICQKGFPNRMLHQDFKQRYSILAGEESKKEDLKEASDAMIARVVKEGGITDQDARVGCTKIFFKAGILARLEDLRDEALSKIILGFQASVRWYTSLSESRRRKEQAEGLGIIQDNIRAWCTLRTWVWFKLYGNIKPMLQAGKEQEQIDELTHKVEELEANLSKEEALRKEMETNNATLIEEKNALFLKLEDARGGGAEAEEKLQKLTSQKADLEKQLASINDKLGSQEDQNADLQRAKKKLSDEIGNLKRTVEDLELALRKVESEKGGKENQLRSLQEEMQQQDEVIAKLNKEKKHQEEVARKITDDLQGEEDKVNHLNKVKSKLEQSLDDLEDNLEREKRLRQETEKAKRKVDGELRIALENLDELNRQRTDAENNTRKKEQEYISVSSRLEDEQSIVAKLQRQVKELNSRAAELEEELEMERGSRSKADRARSELQREMEELVERLDEAGGATSAQIEVSKKREAELSKLRRQLEESTVGHENQLAALRKKHNDSIAELGDQLDQLTKQRAKIEKERAAVQRELEDLHAAVDSESKGKANAEKMCKTLELQLSELQAKSDEQARQLQDFAGLKARLQSENGDLSHQLEEAESQINALHRLKSQLASQLEEAKRSGDEEARERQSLAAQVRNYQNECDTLREQIEEEGESKTEVQRHLSRANAEIQQWKSRYEQEGLVKMEELEEARRKLMQKVNEMQEGIDAANVKIAGLEKQKSKLIGDLEDAQVDVERANSYASQMEKKQKGFDKIVDDWRRKCDDTAAELDAAQRDARNLSTECFKLKTGNEELAEHMEGLRRENRNLAQEIKDLSDQLGEGGRSIHEMQKAVRRLELEKEELQSALDEAEAALEAEESKVLRAQVEVTQIRSEIEKRIQEKEEEFENTRKNHQRAIDSMQASLETESRGRAELLRVKKKLESDINELEIALDHANKANADAQKNIKKYLEQIKELQMQVEEEQRHRDEARESYHNAERRAAQLQSEKEEILASLDQAERARKQAEYDAHEARESANDANNQLSTLSATKRRLDAELQAIHADMEETLNELRSSEERGKNAMADAARLAEELRQEQEHSMHVEHMRKGLEGTLKDMQVRLDEAEAAALKGGRKVIAKLETRVRELETELDGEQRRGQENAKNLAKADRRVRELQFQIEEDKKNQDRLQDLCDKLQQKIKVYKRQVEEAEELANGNLQKYRQLQHQLDDAEERADTAENGISKLRAKARSTVSMGSAIQTSQSAAVLRSSSRVRPSASFADF